MEDLKVLLKDEIEREINSYEDIALGSKEHKLAAETTHNLLEQYIELVKIENDRLEKEQSREHEKTLKQEEMKIDKTDKIVKNVLTGVSVVVGGIIIPIWGVKTSLKFEETGTVTTMAGRAFFGKLFGKK